MAFYGFFSCSSFVSLNNFLNIYNGMILPSLPVPILYDVSITFSPVCISKFAVINDWFLLKWTESILTVSISPYWAFFTSSTSSSCTMWSFLLQHTFLKWPHLPTSGTQLPICWTLSWHMDPTAVPAWVLTCCACCLSHLAIF